MRSLADGSELGIVGEARVRQDDEDGRCCGPSQGAALARSPEAGGQNVIVG